MVRIWKDGRVCPKTELPVPGIECLWSSINCLDKKLALIDRMIPGPARRRECRQWMGGDTILTSMYIVR